MKLNIICSLLLFSMLIGCEGRRSSTDPWRKPDKRSIAIAERIARDKIKSSYSQYTAKPEQSEPSATIDMKTNSVEITPESVIIEELKKYIDSKNTEIVKLESAKIDAEKITNSFSDGVIGISVIKIIEEIDSRIALASQLKSQAELMLEHAHAAKEVDRIRKWLNDN